MELAYNLHETSRTTLKPAVFEKHKWIKPIQKGAQAFAHLALYVGSLEEENLDYMLGQNLP